MINDQATNLRRKMQQVNNTSSATNLGREMQQVNRTVSTKVITITSGKGGVGKSNFTINFALALIEKGYKVAIMDNDIGLANIDVLLGVAPKNTLLDMLEKDLKIFDIIEEGPGGIKFIAGGSELENIFDITNKSINYLLDQLNSLNGVVDILLIDTGAGIKESSLKVLLASDEIFLISIPEPTSITDSYAMIKLLQKQKKDIKLYLVINQIGDQREGNSTANKLKLVSKKFLAFDIKLLGFIHKDDSVSKAVKKQTPFYLFFPNCRASKDIRLLVDTYFDDDEKTKKNTKSKGLTTFLDKMTNWF